MARQDALPCGPGVDPVERDRRCRTPLVRGRAWRIGIAVLGLVVVLAGVVMLILPGPGWVTILVGFRIWATEFAWANSLLASARRQFGRLASWIRAGFR